MQTSYPEYSENNVDTDIYEFNTSLDTARNLADKLQISRANYTRYERNSVRPDYETLIKLADFYDIPLDEIFDRKR